MKQIKNGLYSEYQIQKNDSYCVAYCLYVFYITKIITLNTNENQFTKKKVIQKRNYQNKTKNL